MLTCIAGAGAVKEVAVAARDHLGETVPLRLNHRIGRAGKAVVDLAGELDMATAEEAVNYVRRVIDHHRGPVIVDLATLTFCDAQGLATLVRMASYAAQQDCAFELAAPGPSLVKIMRITGLDRRLPAPQPPTRARYRRIEAHA